MRRIIIEETVEKRKFWESKQKPIIGQEGCYGATGVALTKDGKPWYPVMGEFHFSRFRKEGWREEIAKMKAGGIQILATYVFWIHHEEKQGEWDFEGQKNLRDFLEICKEEDMPVWLRIGPWAHGECRNGGFPDWLVRKKNISLRSDDRGYLEYVTEFWKKIAIQTDGLMYKHGGPIIGIQIENEYGHCGGLQGKAGMQHMCTLKKIAVELGFTTPYYTATGWGGANVPQDEYLPVLAAYCGAPWAQNTEKLPLNANFVFTHYKNDENVGSDLKTGEETGFTYDIERMPFLMAELGGGLQVTAHRRPYVAAQDTVAMALSKVGSGANLLGYYMYHGGTNPVGKYSTLQESKETGYSNDLPIRSYDFQAPIGEYGNIHESYYGLRPLHLFLKEFGSIVASGESILPEWTCKTPKDLVSERVAVRHLLGNGMGFLFYHRHQRHAKMSDKKTCFEIVEKEWRSEVSEIDMKEDKMGWIPYAALDTDGMLLTPEFRLYSANCSPLCRLGNDVVFFGEQKPEIKWTGNGDAICVSTKEAEHGIKYKEEFYTAEGCLIEESKQLYLITNQNKNVIKIYPRKQEIIRDCELAEGNVEVQFITENEVYVEYRLSIHAERKKLYDMWISLEIFGDKGEFWLDEEQIDEKYPDGDWFCQGKAWNISCRYLDWPESLIMRIYHAKSADKVYYEVPQTGKTGIRRAEAIVEYKIKVEE